MNDKNKKKRKKKNEKSLIGVEQTQRTCFEKNGGLNT
jgi:hypothetical protein